MAVTFTGAGTAQNATSQTSVAVTTATAFAVGDYLVALMAYDNSGGGGADPMSGTISLAPATGAVGAGVGGQTGINDPGAASAGLAARCIAFPVTTAIPTSTSVTVSWTGAAVAKAVVFMKVSSAGVTGYRTNSGATGTNTVGAANATAFVTPSITNAEGVLCWTSEENGIALTGDADTTNGSWGSIYGTFNATTAGVGGMAAYFQAKVVTATATQTFNPTGDATLSDWITGCLVFTETPFPAITQASYRIYDDGTETGAPALAAQDTAANGNIATGDGIGQLRVRLQSTNAGVLNATDDWQLQWEKNASGSWTNVGTGDVLGYASTNITEGQATTNRLGAGTGTFVAGKAARDGLVDNLSWSSNNYTELLYSVAIVKANVVVGDVMRFRVLYNGATTRMTYTVTPAVNVMIPSVSATATPSAATGTATLYAAQGAAGVRVGRVGLYDAADALITYGGVPVTVAGVVTEANIALSVTPSSITATSVIAPVVTATGTAPAPIFASSSITSPTTVVAGVGATFAPIRTAASVVTPSVVTATGTTLAPASTTAASAVTSVTSVRTGVTNPAASLAAASAAQPSTLNQTSIIPAVAPGTGVVLTASVVTSTGATYAPTIAVVASVTAVAAAGTGAVPAPIIAAGVIVTPAVVLGAKPSGTAAISLLGATLSAHEVGTATTTSSSTFTAPSGTDRMMVVFGFSEETTTIRPPIAISYGGVPLTEIGTSSHTVESAYVAASAWYLLEADIGSGAKTLFATWATGASTNSNEHLHVVTYGNVKQGAPTHTSLTNSATDWTSQNVTVTVDAITDWAIAVLTGPSGDGIAVTPPAVRDINLTIGTGAAGASQSVAHLASPTVGANTINFTGIGQTRYAAVSFALGGVPADVPPTLAAASGASPTTVAATAATYVPTIATSSGASVAPSFAAATGTTYAPTLSASASNAVTAAVVAGVGTAFLPLGSASFSTTTSVLVATGQTYAASFTSSSVVLASACAGVGATPAPSPTAATAVVVLAPVVARTGWPNNPIDWDLVVAVVNHPVPVVVINSPADAGSDPDTTPTFDFTGTVSDGHSLEYQVQVGTVVESYVAANTSAFMGGTLTEYGQSFVGTGVPLTGVAFRLTGFNPPAGTLRAHIYSNTGTLAAPVPGVILVSSDTPPLFVSTPTAVWNTFTFPSAFTPTNGTSYVVVLEQIGVVGFGLRVDASYQLSIHPGYMVRRDSGVWSLTNSYDLFYMLLRSVETADSLASAGFVNPDDGADTHPFNSGENIQYTVQTPLALGTYFWQVRSRDVVGGATQWSLWTPPTRTLTISAAVVVVTAPSVAGTGTAYAPSVAAGADTSVATSVVLGIGTTSAVTLFTSSTLLPAPIRGYAAGDTAWLPSSLSGMTVWLDASQLGLTHGAIVSQWDNHGSGGTGTVSGSPAPVFQANALNGKPSVKFTALQGRITGTGMVADGSFDWTLIYVGRMWGPNKGRAFSGQYPAYNVLVGTHGPGGEPVMYDNAWLAGPLTGGALWPAIPSPWRRYETVCSNSPRLSAFYADGVLLGTTNQSSGHSNQWNISGFNNTATGESCDCEVAELVALNVPIYGREQMQLEGYFGTKYGFAALPLATGSVSVSAFSSVVVGTSTTYDPTFTYSSTITSAPAVATGTTYPATISISASDSVTTASVTAVSTRFVPTLSTAASNVVIPPVSARTGTTVAPAVSIVSVVAVTAPAITRTSAFVVPAPLADSTVQPVEVGRTGDTTVPSIQSGQTTSVSANVVDGTSAILAPASVLVARVALPVMVAATSVRYVPTPIGIQTIVVVPTPSNRTAVTYVPTFKVTSVVAVTPAVTGVSFLHATTVDSDEQVFFSFTPGVVSFRFSGTGGGRIIVNLGKIAAPRVASFSTVPAPMVTVVSTISPQGVVATGQVRLPIIQHSSSPLPITVLGVASVAPIRLDGSTETGVISTLIAPSTTIQPIMRITCVIVLAHEHVATGEAFVPKPIPRMDKYGFPVDSPIGTGTIIAPQIISGVVMLPPTLVGTSATYVPTFKRTATAITTTSVRTSQVRLPVVAYNSKVLAIVTVARTSQLYATKGVPSWEVFPFNHGGFGQTFIPIIHINSHDYLVGQEIREVIEISRADEVFVGVVTRPGDTGELTREKQRNGSERRPVTVNEVVRGAGAVSVVRRAKPAAGTRRRGEVSEVTRKPDKGESVRS